MGAHNTCKSKSMFGMVIEDLFRNKAAVVGTVLLLGLILAAIFAPLLTPYDPIMDMSRPLQKIGSPGHLLGTDDYGRDLLTRMLYGARISLIAGLVVVSISASFGTAVGLVAGYFGGWIDNLLMRIVDLLFGFPFFILALVLMALLGPSLTNAMLALVLVSWISYARVARSKVLSIREENYVEAIRAIGASNARIMFRHILPNCLAPIVVQATLNVGGTILTLAGLSFLGMGAQPPTPEWGAILSDGKQFMRRAMHLTVVPGLAIVAVVMSLNLIGDALRDALDPKVRKR